MMPKNQRDSIVTFAEEISRVSMGNPFKEARITAISMARIDGQLDKKKINGKIRGLKRTEYSCSSAKPCLTTYLK